MSFELAANYYVTRAHWSKDMATTGTYREGRHGTALCTNESNPVDVYDQEATDSMMPPGWRKRKVIEELPVCKKCEKVKARMEATP